MVSKAWEEIGFRGSDPEVNQGIRQHLGIEDGVSPNVSGDVLEEAVRVGLRDFSLSDSDEGRIFSPEKARKRLREIEVTGFPLASYDALNPRELWVYFSYIEKLLGELGSSRCPWVLKDVRAENAEAHFNHY